VSSLELTTSRLIADFVIEHADAIVTSTGSAPKRGAAQRDLVTLRDAIVASRNGIIVYAGTATDAATAIEVGPDATRVDATACTVIPGFIDPHTHVVFAGNRLDELRRRLWGATYEDIARMGGGIAATVQATRAASEDDLVEAARVRLDEMLEQGTTTCEAKSGYGLTAASELKMLRAIKALDASHAIDIVPTFMGAHDIPAALRDRREDYIATVTEEMIPEVAAGGLAAWCDVFCDRGYFTPQESIAILEAGKRAGLRPRLHADELASSGGCRVAAAVGARSADHLIHVDQEGADTLARADVCAVLLPIAAFYLKLGRFAPARMLIDRNVPVALATDVNPGGGYSPSMPFAIALACFAMHMTLEESIVAATINAAWSLGLDHRAGSLETGKFMDAVLIRGTLADVIRVNGRAPHAVIKRGRVVVARAH
jgi:imidazolonepropionase